MARPLADISRARSERLRSYAQASGSLETGFVSAGLAEWLLDVSDTRVKKMISVGLLDTVRLAGQRWVSIASIVRYTTVCGSRAQHKLKLQSATKGKALTTKTRG